MEKLPRLPLSELELEICKRLMSVKIGYSIFDKMFLNNLHDRAKQIGLTIKQKETVKLLFHKYRRQIPDYYGLCGQLNINL